ncbi:MAG: hypothetical protein ACYDCX_04500 [Acidithiobacillus sp.]
MFKDDLTYSVNPDLHRDVFIVEKNAPVLKRIEHYLDRLQLSDAQRLWIRAQVLARMNAPAETEALYALAFATVQAALATLADGDEMDARLDLWAGIEGRRDESEKRARWLQRQMQPPLLRQPMASRPLHRSLWAGCLRFLDLLAFRRHTAAVRRAWQGEY